MKKLLPFVILFFTASVFAQQAAILDDYNGAYAIYEDNRFGDKAYIRIFDVGENSILARVYEPKTSDDFAILLPLAVNNNCIDIENTPKLIKGKITQSSASKRLIPMVLNWANAWHKNKESISSNTSLELEYDDTYEYSFWIPVFRISKIGKDGDFKIITAGKLSGPKDKRFWDFNGIPATVKSETYKVKME